MNNIIRLGKVRKAREKAAMPPAPDALSFVIKRNMRKGGGFNYWAVKPTGSYDADCDTGAMLAKEYLAFIGTYPTYGNATLLTCIVRDMIDQAKDGAPWSGMHVGFLTDVNQDAMVAAHIKTSRAADKL